MTCAGCFDHAYSGFGAHVYATLDVSAGSTYYVTVGGAGGYFSTGTAATCGNGGFNGGGAGGVGKVAPIDVLNDIDWTCFAGGGGGASDFRSSTTLASRLVVAGGGGGAGGINAGAGRGGDSGSAGGGAGGVYCSGSYSSCAAGAGGGAGTSSGAVGGIGGHCDSAVADSAGNVSAGSAQGGDGASVPTLPLDGSFSFDFSVGGGGGGGGYYGGAGGGGGYTYFGSCHLGSGGGGGGSDYVVPSATGVSIVDGDHGGNGVVTLTYIATTGERLTELANMAAEFAPGSALKKDVEAIQHNVDAGNTRKACKALNGLPSRIKSVAHKGKLTSAEVTQLTELVKDIQSALGC
jgi:hypothetical protein